MIKVTIEIESTNEKIGTDFPVEIPHIPNVGDSMCFEESECNDFVAYIVEQVTYYFNTQKKLHEILIRVRIDG